MVLDKLPTAASHPMARPPEPLTSRSERVKHPIYIYI